MAVTVNTNVASLVAQGNLSKNTAAYTKAMQQLSSGLKINSASDDAAGLSISESIKTQINGNAKAYDNIQDGKNLLSIAEGGQITVTNHLQRIRALCVQAANETYNPTDKNNILEEIKQRVKDITNIANSTTFNGVNLLNQEDAALDLQIGAGSDAATNSLDIGPALTDVRASMLGGYGSTTGGTDHGIHYADSFTGADWTTDNVRAYMAKIDGVITQISSDRALLGAYGNRLDATAENLTTMNQNLEETKSRITDTDVAQASSEMVKYQILQQTSASILTQANQLPSIALTLLNQ